MNSINVTRSANDESFVVFSHQESSQVFVFDRWTTLGDMQDVIAREVKKQRAEQEQRYATMGAVKQGYSDNLDVSQTLSPNAVYALPPAATSVNLDDEIPF